MPDDPTPAWRTHWPRTPVDPHAASATHPDRWVRLLGLTTDPPTTRRAQIEAVLSRHNAVLADLFTDEDVLIIATRRTPDPTPPDPDHWVTLPPDLGAPTTHLHIRRTPWHPGATDPLLVGVADYPIEGVMITSPTLDRVYHPCGDNADVLLPTTTARDTLAHHHSAWLAPRPDTP